MTAMARAGQGNAYYGRTAEDLMDPFRQEFDLMSALCARSLRLALAPADRCAGRNCQWLPNRCRRAAACFPIFRMVAKPGRFYGLRCHAPLSRQSVTETCISLQPALSMPTLTVVPAHSEPVHLRLPRVAAGAFAAMAVNELVSSRAAELNAAMLQEQARSAAQRGDWNQVQHLLQELRAQALSSPWLAASISELEAVCEPPGKRAFLQGGSVQGSKQCVSRLAALDEEEAWSEHVEAKKAVVPSAEA